MSRKYFLYDNPKKNIPDHITHLEFSCTSDRIICIPTSVTHLIFGDRYNETTKQLPQSITHLTFGHCYNQPTDDLPSSITHLTFGYRYNQPA